MVNLPKAMVPAVPVAKDTMHFTVDDMAKISGTDVGVVCFQGTPYVWAEDLCRVIYNEYAI
jgi:hypothetical protein